MAGVRELHHACRKTSPVTVAPCSCRLCC
jgi:hypothetical protein